MYTFIYSLYVQQIHQGTLTTHSHFGENVNSAATDSVLEVAHRRITDSVFITHTSTIITASAVYEQQYDMFLYLNVILHHVHMYGRTCS